MQSECLNAGNKIGDEGCMVLAEALESSTTLAKLDLSGAYQHRFALAEHFARVLYAFCCARVQTLMPIRELIAG
eukprot:2128088-Pleurochrysis_carterae.AAC.1